MTLMARILSGALMLVATATTTAALAAGPSDAATAPALPDGVTAHHQVIDENEPPASPAGTFDPFGTRITTAPHAAVPGLFVRVTSLAA
ncbi:hypothetical protein NQK81_00965 [Amycolatopsis roodepoortensis]|uniref:hypothetical protein n=1 Tax=Amycolatopsis roodepoortensis TaxID=700274 RepID=UPI00214AE28D|nr:hypothetical protein [Amycolatopsis roodepoortensis]UUV32047.1 hypothetical protein NQK81_00965 [Amycolatopsis roodepoortensis]